MICSIPRSVNIDAPYSTSCTTSIQRELLERDQVVFCCIQPVKTKARKMNLSPGFKYIAHFSTCLRCTFFLVQGKTQFCLLCSSFLCGKKIAFVRNFLPRKIKGFLNFLIQSKMSVTLSQQSNFFLDFEFRELQYIFWGIYDFGRPAFVLFLGKF